MLNSIIRLLLAAASLGAFTFAAFALWDGDWHQASAWLLFEISCTLTLLNLKEAR